MRWWRSLGDGDLRLLCTMQRLLNATCAVVEPQFSIFKIAAYNAFRTTLLETPSTHGAPSPCPVSATREL